MSAAPEIDDDEKELIEYEKHLREVFERDMEAFVVQVYTQIQENKERDFQAIRDESVILAETLRIGLHADAIESYNARLGQLYKSMEEYYAPKLAEAKMLSHCSADGCTNARKTRCCFFAYYCSEACQIQHWKDHIRFCNREEFFSADTLKKAKEECMSQNNSAVVPADDAVISHNVVAGGAAVSHDVAPDAAGGHGTAAVVSDDGATVAVSPKHSALVPDDDAVISHNVVIHDIAASSDGDGATAVSLKQECISQNLLDAVLSGGEEDFVDAEENFV